MNAGNPSDRIRAYLGLPDGESRRPKTFGQFLQALCDGVAAANLRIGDINGMRGQTAVKAVSRLAESMADEGEDELRRLVLLLGPILNRMQRAATAILDMTPADFAGVSRETSALIEDIVEVLSRSEMLRLRLMTLYDALGER